MNEVIMILKLIEAVSGLAAKYQINMREVQKILEENGGEIPPTKMQELSNQAHAAVGRIMED